MDAAPWTVSSKKRKSTPSAGFSGRKRQRRNETPSGDNTRQQTLTQAQWMGTPSRFSVDSEIIPNHNLKTARHKTSKKNSTLTQMDFFARPDPMDVGDDGLAMIGEMEPMPQVDGPYQSPRRPRKRKSVPLVKTESQEYQPSKKSRKQRNGDQPSPGSKRSSRRIADQKRILSDPAENLEYFSNALEAAPPTPVRKLEIQDSTADTDIYDIPTQSLLKTPLRQSLDRPSRIPSSQTPDSLPSTVTKSTARQPLRDRSSNARAPPSTPIVYQDSPFAKTKTTQTTTATTSLKKPKTPTASVKVGDSQSNLWSIQATSSPHRALPSFNLAERQPLLQGPGSTGRSVEEAIEIPSTSQPDPESLITHEQATVATPTKEVSEGLPTSTEPYVHPEQPKSTASSSAADCSATTEPAGEDQTWTHIPEPTLSLNWGLENKDQIPGAPTSATRKPTPMPSKTMVEQVEDSESDFGSPIRNDTQFNEEVKERTSSPAAAGSLLIHRDSGHHADSSPRFQPIQEAAVLPQAEHDDSGSSKDSVTLPPPPAPTLHQGFTVTRVPLNDLLPSSSPPLPSTKSTTQRSVRPASMPHPSQISTQEATQGYVGSSFMAMETPWSTQRITIKDSSSARMPMSQIPQQPDSQSQLNIDLGLANFGVVDQDEEEYDLNPPSSGAGPKSVAEPRIVREPPSAMVPIEPTSSPPSTSSPPPKPSERGLRPRKNRSPQTGNGKLVRDATPRASERDSQTGCTSDRNEHAGERCAATNELSSSPPAPAASPSPTPRSSPTEGLARPLHEYTPLPGYNNETQSNFTQGGHVSAAYVHRQREAGLLPMWYIPKCVKVPGYTRR